MYRTNQKHRDTNNRALLISDKVLSLMKGSDDDAGVQVIKPY